MDRRAASDNVKVTDLDCIQCHGKADSLIVVGHLFLYHDRALVAALAFDRLISYLVRQRQEQCSYEMVPDEELY